MKYLFGNKEYAFMNQWFVLCLSGYLHTFVASKSHVIYLSYHELDK